MGCQRKQGLATLSGGLSSSDIVLQLLPLTQQLLVYISNKVGKIPAEKS